MTNQREIIIAAADIVNDVQDDYPERKHALHLLSPLNPGYGYFPQPEVCIMDEEFKTLAEYQTLEEFIADVALAGGVETTDQEIFTLSCLIRALDAERTAGLVD